jgi:CheY-like chemotaxis protein
MRILVLDDFDVRLMYARKKYRDVGELYLVKTAEDAILQLKAMNEWGIVSLDHDLGGEVFVDSDREDCGMEVVRWIVKNNPAIRRINIHTANHMAAPQMIASLIHAGYEVGRDSLDGGVS